MFSFAQVSKKGILFGYRRKFCFSQLLYINVVCESYSFTVLASGHCWLSVPYQEYFLLHKIKVSECLPVCVIQFHCTFDNNVGFNCVWIKTIRNTYSHKQLYRHILVSGFGYWLAIIRPKTWRSTINKESYKCTVTNKSQINTNGNWNMGESSYLT